MTRPGLVPVSGRSLGLSSPEPELSAPHRSPGQARVGWQDGGTQLSVPGIATIASVATTMARVAADTGERVMSHLSCYYPHQLTHKLQLRRTLLNSDPS